MPELTKINVEGGAAFVRRRHSRSERQFESRTKTRTFVHNASYHIAAIGYTDVHLALITFPIRASRSDLCGDKESLLPMEEQHRCGGAFAAHLLRDRFQSIPFPPTSLSSEISTGIATYFSSPRIQGSCAVTPRGPPSSTLWGLMDPRL